MLLIELEIGVWENIRILTKEEATKLRRKTPNWLKYKERKYFLHSKPNRCTWNIKLFFDDIILIQSSIRVVDYKL